MHVTDRATVGGVPSHDTALTYPCAWLEQCRQCTGSSRSRCSIPQRTRQTESTYMKLCIISSPKHQLVNNDTTDRGKLKIHGISTHHHI